MTPSPPLLPTSLPIYLWLFIPPTSHSTDQHPRLQTPALPRPPALLGLRSLPRYPRARVHPCQHPRPPRQGLHQQVLGRGHREPQRGAREVLNRRGGTSSAAGMNCSIHLTSLVLIDGLWTLYDRLAAKFSVHSSRTRPGTRTNGCKPSPPPLDLRRLFSIMSPYPQHPTPVRYLSFAFSTCVAVIVPLPIVYIPVFLTLSIYFSACILACCCGHAHQCDCLSLFQVELVSRSQILMLAS
jgi:hypothetical protein